MPSSQFEGDWILCQASSSSSLASVISWKSPVVFLPVLPYGSSFPISSLWHSLPACGKQTQEAFPTSRSCYFPPCRITHIWKVLHNMANCSDNLFVAGCKPPRDGQAGNTAFGHATMMSVSPQISFSLGSIWILGWRQCAAEHNKSSLFQW